MECCTSYASYTENICISAIFSGPFIDLEQKKRKLTSDLKNIGRQVERAIAYFVK